VGAGVPVGAIPGPIAYAPAEPEPADVDEVEAPADEAGGSLASVAKAAAMKAERAAIEQTLRQVHWNRRKAAQILGVSYKTLLNKIKECGISRA
jgi:DNA-binding NtrC family response regulator